MLSGSFRTAPSYPLLLPDKSAEIVNAFYPTAHQLSIPLSTDRDYAWGFHSIVGGFEMRSPVE
jgi:hypothetical protein